MSNDNCIAIIGMSCRFPGASTVEQFWDNLINARESISSFDKNDLLLAGIDQKVVEDPAYVTRAGVIENIDLFDASFFDFTAKEAELLDPQHRFLLECAHEAMENAGCTYDERRSTGVYVGVGSNEYFTSNIAPNSDLMDSNSYQITLGNEKDFAATYLSYKLDLKGPSVTVSTACSTSLVAIHMACRSLLSYECDIALSGAAKIAVPHNVGYLYKDGGIDSPDGHCRAFDIDAKGTVIGNGVGVVVLKRYQDAIDDGDHIFAVIKGSAVNNDGALKVGFTAPSVDGQSSLIQEVLDFADVHPETIGYVEAHGTGTMLGDPIEVAALTSAYKSHTRNLNFCPIGSVKTNIGHLDVAAGIAGLIKAILAIKHKTLPASLHYKTPNPAINFSDSPFYVNKNTVDWQETSSPRRAAVSSFGLGGSNAHIILEEAPYLKGIGNSSREHHLLVFSAKTESALKTTVQNYSEFLSSDVNDLADIAYTLQVGRKHHSYRCAYIRANQAISSLDMIKEIVIYKTNTQQSLQLGFILFTEENFLPDVAASLYTKEKFFQMAVDTCADLLYEYIHQDIRPLFLTERKNEEHDTQSILVRRCLNFSLKYAYIQLLRFWGIDPSFFVGFGLNEIVFACESNVFNLETALLILISNSKNSISGLKKIELSTPSIPFVSSKTKTWIKNSEARDLNYWVNLELTVPHDVGAAIKILEPKTTEDNICFLFLGSLRSSKEQMALLSTDLINKMQHCFPEQPINIFEHNVILIKNLWLRGLDINWKNLHGDEHGKKVPMPTYPFERSRHWVEPLTRKITSDPHGKTLEQSICYESSWKISSLPQKTFSGKNRSCILFLDQTKLANKLLQSISTVYSDVIQVYRGLKFKKEGLIFSINHKNPEHYTQLFKAINDDNYDIDGVIHLWSISADKKHVSSPQFFEYCQEVGFYSLRLIAQELAKLHHLNELKMLVVSNCIHKITGEELIYPEKSLLVAACKVISQEYPYIRCSSVDLSARHIKDKLCAELILNEFTCHLIHRTISYRGNSRWIEHYEKCVFEPENARFLKEHGVYLITGGLGNIGLHIAEFFSSLSKINIVLLSRSSFPKKENWVDYLKHNPHDELSIKIDRLMKIEQSGSTIWIISADVSDYEQMTELFLWMDNTFGHINGIVHAAGNMSEGFKSIEKSSKVECERIFQPKINGLYVLDLCLRNRQLDFCVLISSLASVLGGVNYFAYASANLFMDYFARAKNHLSDNPVWCSINWDGWEQAKIDSKKEGLNYTGDLLTPEDALSAFRLVLENKSFSQLIVTKQDLKNEVYKWLDKPFNIKSSSNKDSNHSSSSPIPCAFIESEIHKIWIDLFGMKDIPHDRDFFHLGGDSLLIIQLAARIRQQLNVSLPLEQFFKYSTISKLANILIEKISAQDEREEETTISILRAFWFDLLGSTKIKSEDSFFDLGGDSLSAIQLVSRVRQKFKLNLELDTIYKYKTLGGLSHKIDDFLKQDKKLLSCPAISSEQRPSNIPLSYAQQRLWLLDKIVATKHAYNIVLGWKLLGPLNKELLLQSFQNLINRHELLRTSFIEKDSKPVQIINPNSSFSLVDVDLTRHSGVEQDKALQLYIRQEETSLFDLSNGPLLRGQLLALDAEQHVLLVGFHHIIIDGWSIPILEKELSHFYNNDTSLSKLPIQYADYSIWQRNKIDNIINQQLKYWQVKLKDSPSRTAIPVDFSRPAQASYKGAVHNIFIPSDLVDRLSYLCQQYDLTLFMMLLSVFYTLLYRYSGQEDIVIGSPIANRRYIEIENLIGFFANTLALRIRGSLDERFIDLLAQVKTMALEAYEHQDVPFEQLVDHLQITRDLSQNPVFQVMISFHKLDNNAIKLQDLTVKHLELNYQVSKFDLTLWVQEGYEGESGLRLGFEYATDLFEASTIERMAQHFER
ncbi:MAG: SDR family NAD(P)-dependent oxidoreductase, partial [Gammaproteobacteria bacterium]|nr:SDR family NAD(P)-dependent oxidoreductase [Gammaproteobacteria bacterium]